MNRLFRCYQMLIKEEKGNVLFIVAGALILLLGMAALVIDVGQLYVARRQMVNAADASVLAGVMEAKHQNKKFAKDNAEEYALYNGANEIFDQGKDIYFHGDGDAVIMSVRVFSNEVEYTFARVLGFESTLVPAIASAQVGPGNPLTPFVDIGWECDECDDDNGNGTTDECDKCGGLGYYIYSYEEDGVYKPAEEGDHFELKFDHWKDWLGDTPGDFPYLQLPGQKGAKDLKENIAGGYTGDLGDVAIGTTHRAETGSKASARDGIFSRMTTHGPPYCTYDDFECSGWYKCDLVIVIPIVIHAPEVGNKYFRIVGYASLLLDVVDYDGEKNVWAWFLEYLTPEQLEEILPKYLEGFVTRLVEDPEEALTFFSNSR